TSIGDSAVAVNAEVTAVGGDFVTERGLVWGTNEDPLLNTDQMVLGAHQGSYEYTIPSIELFVKYYIHAYAINSFGTTYSEPLIIVFMPPTYTDPRDGEVY